MAKISSASFLLYCCWFISRGSREATPITSFFLLPNYEPRGLCSKQCEVAASAAMLDQALHVRSNSLPSRSHPVAIRVEEELHMLRTSATPSTSSLTPQKLCNALQRLGNLSDCINELCLPCNHQVVGAELDGFIWFLDLCAALRDNLNMAKHHIQDIQSTLRRNDAALESKLHRERRPRRISRHVSNP